MQNDAKTAQSFQSRMQFLSQNDELKVPTKAWGHWSEAVSSVPLLCAGSWKILSTNWEACAGDMAKFRRESCSVNYCVRLLLAHRRSYFFETIVLLVKFAQSPCQRATRIRQASCSFIVIERFPNSFCGLRGMEMPRVGSRPSWQRSSKLVCMCFSIIS